MLVARRSEDLVRRDDVVRASTSIEHVSDDGEIDDANGYATAPAAARERPPVAPPANPPVSTERPANPPATTTAAKGPEGATAKCKDGTYSHSKQHSGTCSRHGGVAEWYK